MRNLRFLLMSLVTLTLLSLGQFAWSAGRAEFRSRALERQFEAGPGSVVDFAQIGPSDWDRVFIFHPYYPYSGVGDAVGCDWEYAEGSVGERVNLVVFARGREVVGWFEHPRNRGELDGIASAAGYTRNQAQFKIALDQEKRLFLVSR